MIPEVVRNRKYRESNIYTTLNVSIYLFFIVRTVQFIESFFEQVISSKLNTESTMCEKYKSQVYICFLNFKIQNLKRKEIFCRN